MEISKKSEKVRLTLELGESDLAHLSREEKALVQQYFNDSFGPLIRGLVLQISSALEAGPLLAVYFSQLADKLLEVSDAQIKLLTRVENGEDPMELMQEYFLTRVGDVDSLKDQPSDDKLSQGPFGKFIKKNLKF